MKELPNTYKLELPIFKSNSEVFISKFIRFRDTYLTTNEVYRLHWLQNTDFKAKLRYKQRVVEQSRIPNICLKQKKVYLPGEKSILPVANSSQVDFYFWGFFIFFFFDRSLIASFWTMAIIAAGALVSPLHYNYH